MTPDLAAAATRLAATLADENAALRALDLPRAATFTEAKARAIEAFTAVQRPAGGAPAADPAQQQRWAEQLAHLRRVADDNRRLLERAIAIQSRVIGVVARAVPRTLAATAPRYGADGGTTTAGRPLAFALSARA